MDEEIKEEPKEEVKKPETKLPLITDADEAAERLEKATEEYKALVGKHEELVARQIIGGKSVAGDESKAPVLSPTEYANAFREGKIEGKLKADVVKK